MRLAATHADSPRSILLRYALRQSFGQVTLLIAYLTTCDAYGMCCMSTPDGEVRLAAPLDRFSMLNFAAPLARALRVSRGRPAAIVLRPSLYT